MKRGCKQKYLRIIYSTKRDRGEKKETESKVLVLPFSSVKNPTKNKRKPNE